VTEIFFYQAIFLEERSITLISTNLMITFCIAFNKPFSKLLMPSEGIFVRPIVVRYRTVLHLSLNRITFTCYVFSPYGSEDSLIWNRPEDIANNCMVFPLYEFADASSYWIMKKNLLYNMYN
jgi:hypothetical protein